MYIHEIIPLTNLPASQPQILSYFGSQKLKRGSLVTAPLARKKTSGIVIASHPLPPKISIKKASFKLKPVGEILNPEPVLTENQLSLFEWLTEYYYLPLSGLTKTALPSPSFLKKIKDLKTEPETGEKPLKTSNFFVFKDDFDYFSEKIRKTIRENRQILFIFPNQIKMGIYLENFKDFEKETVIFDRRQPQKQFFKIYSAINNNEKKIIMGRRSAISAPFSNLGLIVVVEEENLSHNGWETKIHFNSKTAAFKLAELFKSDLIFTSANPSVESWFLIKKGFFETKGEPPNLILKKECIFDMKKTKSDTVIHPDLLEKIKKIIDQNAGVLVFVNRRGLSSALICEDCGYVIKCPNCEAAMVYHYIPPIIELRCHHCGFKKEPADLCPNCQSHLIKFLGVGTQKMIQFFKKHLPDVKIEKFDSDNLKKIEEEKKIFEKFENGEIKILVATELVFKFLEKLKGKIDLAILVSLEQNLVFPDFRAEERLKRTIQKLSSSAREIALQTFNPEKDFLRNVQNLDKFYENELELRTNLNYPPFFEIIKIIIQHKNRDYLNRLAVHLHQLLRQNAAKTLNPGDYYVLPPLSAFIPKIKGRFVKELFFKIKRDYSQPTSLADIEKRNKILRCLPDETIVKIDPLNLL